MLVTPMNLHTFTPIHTHTCCKLSLSKPWSSGWASSRKFLPSRSYKYRKNKVIYSYKQSLQSPARQKARVGQQRGGIAGHLSWSADLRLVANCGHTTVIYERERALTVMTWNELHRDGDVIQVVVTWATCYLDNRSNSDNFEIYQIVHWQISKEE